MKNNSALSWGMKTLAILALFAGAVAFGDDSSTSTASANEVAPVKTKTLNVKYLGVAFGPSVRGISEGNLDTTPDGTKVTVFNRFIFSTNLTKEITAGFNSESLLNVSPKLTALDQYVRFGHSNWVTMGNLKISGDFFRAYLPTSNDAHNVHRIVGLRVYPVIELQIPGSRWSITSYQYFQKDINAMQAGGDQAIAEWVPIVTYQLTPKFGIYADFDGFIKNKQSASAFDWTNGYSAWDLGTSIDVTPKVNVSPYLELPANLEAQKTLGTLTVNVAVSAKLL